jgi:hypothetical protein
MSSDIGALSNIGSLMMMILLLFLQKQNLEIPLRLLLGPSRRRRRGFLPPIVGYLSGLVGFLSRGGIVEDRGLSVMENPLASLEKGKAFVYHTPYKRYKKMVKVPRGQASFTMNENIHYNYGRIAGGSPPNEIMCDRLKEITHRVNEGKGRNYNTILMNVYKDNKDALAAHQDKNKNLTRMGVGRERVSQR